jgi:hypothetical protein
VTNAPNRRASVAVEGTTAPRGIVVMLSHLGRETEARSEKLEYTVTIALTSNF